MFFANMEVVVVLAAVEEGILVVVVE